MQKINLKNAVLYKDMVIRAKRSNMSVLIFVVNLILAIAAAVLLIVINGSLATFSTISPATLPWFFIIVVIFESALVCIVIPPSASTAISGERERQTLDVLITTNMTPLEIVLGKYFSCLVYIGLVLLSTLPILSIVFIYGSMSLFQVLAVFGSILVIAMYLAAIGIFFSTVCKKSGASTVLSFLVFGALIFGTIIIVATVALIVEIINLSGNIYGSTGSLVYDPAFFLLYLNPAATVLDVLGRTVGFSIDSTDLGGMNKIGESLTQMNANHFLLNFWTPISILIQLGLSWLLLLGSAKKLDPSKQKNKKVKTVERKN